MRRLTLAAAIAVLALGSAGTADAQVRQCAPDNRVAGTVIGGLVGATAGGVIANNTRRGSFRRGRGFNRGYGFRDRGFRGRGFRGARGFRGHRGFRRGRGYRRGNNGAGIVLGALAGGIIGNQIAANNSRNCQVVVGPTHRGDPFASGHGNTALAGGNIDYNAARLGDPYGGQRVVPRNGTTTNRPAAPVAPQQGGVFQPVCETTFRTTQLPNGGELREPIEVCQFSEGGEWIPR